MYYHLHTHTRTHTHTHTYTHTHTHAHTHTRTHADMIECRREVVEKLHEFEQTIDPIVQLFEDPEVQEYIENRK